MRVLLRQIDMQLYYAGPNEWTSDARRAVDFGSVDAAMKTSHQAGLKRMEVVLSYNDGNADPTLEVPAED